MIRNIQQTTFRGKHTLLDYTNFFIPHKNIDSTFINIKLTCRNILTSNNIRIVEEASSILPLKNFPTPDGWCCMFLLDESHLSLHAYTNCDINRGAVIGKLAVDLFTCSSGLNHNKAIKELNQYIVENYNAVLHHSAVIDRF